MYQQLAKKGGNFLIHSTCIDAFENEDDISETIQNEKHKQFYFEYWKKYLSVTQIIKTIKSRVSPTRPLVLAIRNKIHSYKDK